MTNSNLVPVFTGQLQDQTIQLCNARELHAVLEVGKDFSNWIKDRIAEYGFTEGEDYSPKLANRSDGKAGRRRTDYHLTLDMAKELAMIENNDKGRQVRRYFIACEKKSRPPAFSLRAVMLEDNSDPILPLPSEIQSALNKKAWAMAHDAYELCREHLARRVAYTSVLGNPRRVEDKRALEVIAESTLDTALITRHRNMLHCAVSIAESMALMANKQFAEMSREFERLNLPA